MDLLRNVLTLILRESSFLSTLCGIWIIFNKEDQFDNTIRHSDFSIEEVYTAVIILTFVLVPIHDKVEQHVAQFPHIDKVFMCLTFYYVHSQCQSQGNDEILAELMVFLPYLFDFGMDILEWCMGYTYQVSKYYTPRSIIQYMVYITGLTMLLTIIVASCGHFIQNQTSGIGDETSLHHFIRKRVVNERPEDKTEPLVFGFDCMEVEYSLRYETILYRETNCTSPRPSLVTTKTILSRYRGEDIQMKCQYDVDTDDLSLKLNTLWFRDKQLVASEDRYHVEDHYELHGSTYRITSFLSIYMANSGDFANYECWGEKQSVNTKKGTIFSIFALRAFFSVKPIPYIRKAVPAPIGLFMTLRSMDYYVLGRKQSIQFEHRVENGTDSVVSKYFSFMFACSPFTALYSSIHCIFFSKSRCTRVPFGVTRFKDDNLLQYSYVFCTNPQNIGEHKIQIKRNIKNRIDGEVERHVYDLPLSVSLVPDSSLLYMEMKNLSYLEDTSAMLQKTPPSWDIIFTVLSWIRTILESICIFALYVFISYVLSQLWRIFIDYYVVRVKRITLKRANLISKQKNKKRAKQRQKPRKYDALVLHHDDDRNIVRKDIVQPLEKAGYRLLFPARDWADKGNLPGYKIHADALENSERIIIVFSNKFKKDQFCMNTYLDSMTIARVANGTLRHKDVCFVLLQPCGNIPHDAMLALPHAPVLKLERKPKKGRQLEKCVVKIRQWIDGKLPYNNTRNILYTHDINQ
ncbi:uncharacterized protein LOC117343141 [Pecten maximus]|uniref:uncharacterized protein LOC117343141 n=1 Tax=Pecten maximus TaxID=6579 RepID=UPI00145844AB|nr:uncharacterized protein LOC117343141 [Pecten maximus]